MNNKMIKINWNGASFSSSNSCRCSGLCLHHFPIKEQQPWVKRLIKRLVKETNVIEAAGPLTILLMGGRYGKCGTYRPVGGKWVIPWFSWRLIPKQKKTTMMSFGTGYFDQDWDWGNGQVQGSQTQCGLYPNGGAELAISTFKDDECPHWPLRWWLICRGFNNWWMRLVELPSNNTLGFPISIADQEEFNEFLPIGVGRTNLEWGGARVVFTDALPRPRGDYGRQRNVNVKLFKRSLRSFEPKQCESLSRYPQSFWC